MKIERIPQDVTYAIGPLRYTSRYSLNGNTLQVRREFVGNKPTCGFNIHSNDLYVERISIASYY